MWYFRSPEIVFGRDALDHLTHLSGSKAFIVTDPVIRDLGFVERVRDKLKVANIASETFSEVEAEPTLKMIQRGTAAMTSYQPDWIIGLGGGSPMASSSINIEPKTDFSASTFCGGTFISW